MALDQKQLQKKRAKREQKRKQIKSGGAGLGGLLSFAKEWTQASQAPVKDALAPVDLFEKGMGSVWISRALPDGRFALASFLLDVCCMGVKNALYKIASPDEYAEIWNGILTDTAAGFAVENFEHIHPSCARKLVEQAHDYAKDLGFKPHADYKVARLIFGDLDASVCPESFTFGKDGKPFYCQGPNETEAMARRIIKQLEHRCGPDGYLFIIPISEFSDS